MQYFHWYYPADGSLWKKVRDEVPKLASMGITALWLPPAYKGINGASDVGYGIYDLYDLGEFNQKGSIRTKYGTKDEYIQAIEACHANHVQVYADVVFNHKAGADDVERIEAIRVNPFNRLREEGNPVWIDAWTKFTFPGRNNQYSSFQWHWPHFDSVDWAENLQEKAIFKILQRESSWESVDEELGNYDYLMFADLDIKDPEVQSELKAWFKWYINLTDIDGLRIDAIKHIDFSFFKQFLDWARAETGKELFTVGEYWNPDNVGALLFYLYHSGERMSLFDAPLHKNFYVASRQKGLYDMRTIFNNTLMQIRPTLCVSLVDNHDTQPLQALESPVDYWFKPLAYAIILLREQGYPCVFYPDLYGAGYRDMGRGGRFYDIILAPVPTLQELLAARKKYAYGTQVSFIDHWNVIGWTRQGDEEHQGSGCAVIMSNGPGGSKWMNIGKQHARRKLYDYLGNCSGQATVNEDGWAEFRVNDSSVSVWVFQN